ncbi:hypothetical protein C2S51_000524 [Perilla frutescens var. frutescens]|nr:hypothetical protein C2S51_000524 [Perilla frutescens var. frutescens]
MPKQNRRLPWNQILMEERGFHIDATVDADPGESSNRSIPQQIESVNTRNMQRDEAGRELATYRTQSNDVLHVHANDHPGMLLTTDLLTGKNFHSWSRSIKRGLAVKHKLALIDGTMSEPDINSIDYNQWLRVDCLVFSWIVNSISKELGRGFQHIETSKDLCFDQNALYSNQRSVHSRNDGFRRRLSKEEKQKLKCSHCGGNGHEKADCFDLIGVPEWYKKYRTDKGKIRAHYVDDEDQQSVKDDCHSQVGDTTADMNKMIQMEIAKYIGTYLQKSGAATGVAGNSLNSANMVDTDKMSADESDAYMGHYAFGLMSEIYRNEWIVDSGANTHMCCNPSLMQNLIKLDEPQKIYLPDGSNVMVQYTGSVHLNDNIILKHVLFAPSFTHNLISVGQMTKDLEGKVIFLPTHCIIQNHQNEQALGIGKLRGKLYVFKHEKTDNVYSTTASLQLGLKEWHEILGHPSVGSMKHMLHLKRKFPDTGFEELRDCEICYRAKQQRLPFPVLNQRSEDPFSLIHADVWGPYHEETITNTSYILTLVEDHSRTTWTYLLHSKGQVYQILRSFFLMVHDHFHITVFNCLLDSSLEASLLKVVDIPYKFVTMN